MEFDELFREYYHIKKPIKTKWRNHSVRKYCSYQLWFVILFSIVLFSLIRIHHLSPLSGKMGFMFSVTSNFVDNNKISSVKVTTKSSIREQVLKAKFDEDSCLGRYIYVHDLPARFNDDVLKNCQLLNRPTDKSNMCDNILNFGFGPNIEDAGNGVLQNRSWYSTNQFLLEVIFHNRMKKYKCLTNDSSLASAIFVPFYAGLDLRRYLWRFNTSVRDSSAVALVNWLTGKPEWKRMLGKDHFLVAGRISRDFRRQSDRKSDWGSKFRFLPESENMAMLSIETSTSSKNDYAIPYPTYFHPSTDSEVSQWQDRLRRKIKRDYLFSFAGAPRSNRKGSIRGEVINQCKLASNRTCKLLDCDSSTPQHSCDDPVNVMKLFQRSVFCLQPPGDSFTRRSIFDSILAGCIPVFFHPGSSYDQYIWHLPKNRTKYSVYIPGRALRNGKVSIEQKLLGISEDRVEALKEEVIRLIPRIIYVDPRSRFDGFEDAFDIAVKGILERVKGIRQGRVPSKLEISVWQNRKKRRN